MMKRFAPEPLVFPIGDKDYTVPPVDIERGWKLSEILAMEPAAITKAKITEEDFFRLAMGDVWQQMIDDKVDMGLAWRAGMAAVGHYQVLAMAQGSTEDTYKAARLAAEAMWESGLDPKALASWALQRQEPPDSTPSTSTGVVRKTPTRASGTGTTSPRTTRPGRAKASPSASRTSSRKKT